MHATSNYQNSGSKVTKIAIVTALHVGVALALINMKVITGKTETPPPITVTLDEPKARIDPEVAPPPPTTLPPIFVPHTDTVMPTPPDTVRATDDAPPLTPPPKVVGPQVIAPPPPAELVKEAVKDVFKVASAGNCPVPNYPANSARNGDTGTVGLALLIAPDGHVADSRVTTSSGFRELDRAAVAALSSCKFKPATTNGVPESAWGKIAYVWTLE
jgi:protein TonB